MRAFSARLELWWEIPVLRSEAVARPAISAMTPLDRRSRAEGISTDTQLDKLRHRIGVDDANEDEIPAVRNLEKRIERLNDCRRLRRHFRRRGSWYMKKQRIVIEA
jgi:hypothetical protein